MNYNMESYQASIEENQQWLINNIHFLDEKSLKWIKDIFPKNEMYLSFNHLMNSLKSSIPLKLSLLETKSPRCKLGLTLCFVDEFGNKALDKVECFICHRCGCEFRIETMTKIVQWRKHLLCTKCSKKISFSSETLEKMKNTMVARYGVDHPTKSLDIRKRTIDTCQQKYGTNSPLESVSVRKKITKTMCEKYGVDNPFKSNEFQEKARDSLESTYGVRCTVHSPVILKKIMDAQYIQSKVELNFFSELSNEIPFKILFGSESLVVDTEIGLSLLDGFIPCKNVVVEFNGDYWHCNPRFYKDPNKTMNFYNKQMTVSEVWERDRKREEAIKKKLNCSFIIVWEDDWKNDPIGVINKIKENLK